MTDLGNGLFAISVPEGAELQYNNERIAFITDEGFETVKPKFEFEILGTVTKLKIDFDYRAETGLGTFDFYDLLSSKGLHFENPYGEPPHNIGLLHTYPTGQSLTDASFKPAIKWRQAQNNLIDKLVIIKKV